MIEVGNDSKIKKSGNAIIVVENLEKKGGSSMTTPEEYFGEELAQLIRELMIEACQSTMEERSHLVASMRADAVNQQNEKVRTVLLKIAERVESMEVVK